MRKHSYSDFNWKEIQKYHDTTHTHEECRKKFGYSRRLEWTAESRGDLVLKPKSYFIALLPIPDCLNCGKKLKYHKAKFCSHSCSATFNNPLTKIKQDRLIIKACEQCRKKFSTPKNPRYTKRFCSKKCRGNNTQNNNEKKFKDGQLKEGSCIVKRILYKKYKGCQECGRRTWRGEVLTLHVHHKDDDPTNNKARNLQLLCPNCHTIAHVKYRRIKKKSRLHKYAYKNARASRAKYYKYVIGPKSKYRKLFLKKNKIMPH